MSTQTMPQLLRLPAVQTITGLRATSIYTRSKRGLLTPPIKITPRSSAWPAHEIEAVVAAQIAGKSEDEIRELVTRLVADRQAAG